MSGFTQLYRQSMPPMPNVCARAGTIYNCRILLSCLNAFEIQAVQNILKTINLHKIWPSFLLIHWKLIIKKFVPITNCLTAKMKMKKDMA